MISWLPPFLLLDLGCRLPPLDGGAVTDQLVNILHRVVVVLRPRSQVIAKMRDRVDSRERDVADLGFGEATAEVLVKKEPAIADLVHSSAQRKAV